MSKRKHSKQPDDQGTQFSGIGNPTSLNLQLKGESVVEGKNNLEPSGEFMKNNSYKTPPNNLTSKGLSDKEKG